MKHIRAIMKTLTEFNGFALKNALETKKQLVAAGKTAEELPAAMGEALKLEGDKLTFYLAAIEVAEARPDNLKRVVVLDIPETEKAPKGAEKKGEKYFIAEYFYTPAPKREGRGQGRHEGRGDGKKRGKGRGGRGGRGQRDERGRGGRPGQGAEQNASGATGEARADGGGKTGEGESDQRRRRRPRGPRRPRSPDAQGAPQSGKGPQNAKPSGGLPKPLERPIATASTPTSQAPAATTPAEGTPTSSS
jgi:hypothetical protein